jgi:UPF0755 protein
MLSVKSYTETARQVLAEKSKMFFSEHSLEQFRKNYTTILAVSLLFVVIVFYNFVYKPPKDFPTGVLVTIEEGSTLAEIAGRLKDMDVIRSSWWLQNFVRMIGGGDKVVAGDYFFSTPRSLLGVAKIIIRGEYGLFPTRVTVPEGASTIDMVDIFTKEFGRFDASEFLALARDKEGYLFPDTYFFLPNVRAQEIVRAMEENFYKKVFALDELQEKVKKFGKPWKDVIIMASLLEKEARDMETRRTIAGILWKRLDIGMPLQVDAVFLYINGKNSYQLTLNDLATSSPYNTYKYKGLPPGPIDNPGIDAIIAAVTPIESDYLYYLSDRHGNTYYAETFEEHKKNRRLYLD